jgi:hypothetical protein
MYGVSDDCVSSSGRFIRFPLLGAFLRQLPLLDALEYPIDVMLFRLELADGIGRMGGDQ